jgi:hypothetical protein
VGGALILHLLERDTQIAQSMRMIAFLVCVGSIAIAVWTEFQMQRERLARERQPPST